MELFIISLCREAILTGLLNSMSALKILKAEGNMGDLDDGPDQKPLDEHEVEQSILELLPAKTF